MVVILEHDSWFSPLLQCYRWYWAGSAQGCKKQRTYSIKCAMDASYGDMSDGSTGNSYFYFGNCEIGKAENPIARAWLYQPAKVCILSRQLSPEDEKLQEPS